MVPLSVYLLDHTKRKMQSHNVTSGNTHVVLCALSCRRLQWILTVNNMGFLSNTSPSRREQPAVLFLDKYSVLNMVSYV
jgi:hypothetical protein